MTLSLMFRPPVIRVVRLDAAEFEVLVALSAELQRADVLCGVTRIYAPNAVHAYDASPGPARAYLCLAGVRELADAREAFLHQSLPTGVDALILDEANASSPLDRVALRCFSGDPSANDAMIATSFGVPPADLDAQSPTGWLTFLPVLPLDPAVIAWANSQVARCSAGLQTHTTVNLLSARAVDFVIGVRFRREPGGISAAHDCLERLVATFASQGYLPYRVDIDRMGLCTAGVPTEYANLLHRVRAAFDPGAILSPGRYGAEA